VSPAGDAKASGGKHSEGSATSKRFADGSLRIPGEEEPGRPDPSPGRSIPEGGTKLKGGTGGTGASVPAAQRTSVEIRAREASEEPPRGIADGADRVNARRASLTERWMAMPRKGKPSKSSIPGAPPA